MVEFDPEDDGEDANDEETEGISEQDFEVILREAIEDRLQESDVYVSTYKESGILTLNRGLVVDLDGEQFQVTIIKV